MTSRSRAAAVVVAGLVWIACASGQHEVTVPPAPPPAVSSPSGRASAPDAGPGDAAAPDGGPPTYVTDPKRCPPGTRAVLWQMGACAPCIYGRKCPCSPTLFRCMPPPPPPPPVHRTDTNECAYGSTCPGGAPCQCCNAGGPHIKCLCTAACTGDQDCTAPGRRHCNKAPGAAKGMCTAPDFTCCWRCR